MNGLLNTLQFADTELATLCQRCVIALLHFLWQGTVIGVAVVLANRLLQRQSAAVRYWLLCLAMLSLPVCVVATFALIRLPSQTESVDVTTANTIGLDNVPRFDKSSVESEKREILSKPHRWQ